MIIELLLMIASLICAWFSLRTRRVLHAAIWLACTSALVAALLYGLGAAEVAVIELSVGAGLVTVLFVFGITIAGEDAMDLGAATPWALAGGVVAMLVGILAWFTLPAAAPATAVAEPSFSIVLWENRGLDVLVQIGLIFAGVLGILGILAEKETAQERAKAATPERNSPLPQPQMSLETAPETPIKEARA